jgi:hypothetical protein
MRTGAIGCSDGAWTLPELSAEFASPDAALHIGPQFVILEASAIDHAARTAASSRLQGVSTHVMFLARGKCGPFRFTGEVIRGASRTIAVRTLGYDDGADGKLITTASHMFESSIKSLESDHARRAAVVGALQSRSLGERWPTGLFSQPAWFLKRSRGTLPFW